MAKTEKTFEESIARLEEIVTALESFLPDFRHEEKGRNLDQKM